MIVQIDLNELKVDTLIGHTVTALLSKQKRLKFDTIAGQLNQDQKEQGIAQVVAGFTDLIDEIEVEDLV